MSKQAYEIGKNAAENNGECIPVWNKDLQEMIKGMPVGTGAADIYKSFIEGVNAGIGL